MSKVTVMNHPLISHKLSILRHKNTKSKDFRELLNEIASLMTYDICRDLKTKEVEVETPICTAKCQTLDKDIKEAINKEIKDNVIKDIDVKELRKEVKSLIAELKRYDCRRDEEYLKWGFYCSPKRKQD